MERFEDGQSDKLFGVIGLILVNIFAENRVIISVLVFALDDDLGVAFGHQLLVDEDAADTAVAVAKWVDVFKFNVKIGDFLEKITFNVVKC